MAKKRWQYAGVGLLLGMVVWVVDAALDAAVFLNGGFMDFLLFDVPPHEVYVRVLIIGLLLIGGWMVGTQIDRLRDRNRDLSLFRTVLDEANDAVFVIDPETGRFVDANETAAERLGYDLGTFLEMTVPDIDPRFETVREYRDHITSGDEETEKLETVHERVDGTTIPVEITAETVDIDRRRYRIAICRDVSDLRKRERERIEALETYRGLFEGINDAVFVHDLDGQFLAVNEAATERLGYDEGTLLEMSPAEIDTPEEAAAVESRIERIQKEGSLTFETVHLAADGSEIPVEITASLVEYFGEPAVLSVARDISVRKVQKRALERENERLEEVASIIAHDLRNPLTVAEGRIELARETGELDHLATATDAIERSQRLIDDVLSLAREGKPIGDRDPVSVEHVAEMAWEHVDTAGANLEVNAEKALLADESRLQQLFENLFRNAVEHGGREVTVTVGDLPEGFFVEDDGPGIPPEKRRDVFEVGFSTGEDNTGLGLNIVEQIADAHDWTVTITGSENGGARFEFSGATRPDSC